MAQQLGSETRAGIEEGGKELEFLCVCVCVCSFVLSLPEQWRPHQSPVWLVSHARLGAAQGCQLRQTIAAPRGHSRAQPCATNLHCLTGTPAAPWAFCKPKTERFAVVLWLCSLSSYPMPTLGWWVGCLESQVKFPKVQWARRGAVVLEETVSTVTICPGHHILWRAPSSLLQLLLQLHPGGSST